MVHRACIRILRPVKVGALGGAATPRATTARGVVNGRRKIAGSGLRGEGRVADVLRHVGGP